MTREDGKHEWFFWTDCTDWVGSHPKVANVSCDSCQKREERERKLVSALEKCREHAWLDDPDWNNRTALAFAARCGLVDAEVNKALAEWKEAAK